MRLVVGLTVITEVLSYFSAPAVLPLFVQVIYLLTIVAGSLLILGFQSQTSAVLISIAIAGSGLFSAPLSRILAATISLGVMLLGPGAYSLDARIFGRREIIIPPSSRV